MTSSVQFIVNEMGEKTAVIMSLEEYEALLEDLDDLRVALERKNEDSITYEDFKKDILENDR